MAITFKTWTQPTTGEVRIYLSGVIGQSGAKIWVSKQAADTFGCDWTVNIRADWAMDLRTARNEASDQIEARFSRKAKFADILAVAQ